jgi:hypothetical protein
MQACPCYVGTNAIETKIGGSERTRRESEAHKQAFLSCFQMSSTSPSTHLQLIGGSGRSGSPARADQIPPGLRRLRTWGLGMRHLERCSREHPCGHRASPSPELSPRCHQEAKGRRHPPRCRWHPATRRRHPVPPARPALAPPAPAFLKALSPSVVSSKRPGLLIHLI